MKKSLFLLASSLLAQGALQSQTTVVTPGLPPGVIERKTTTTTTTPPATVRVRKEDDDDDDAEERREELKEKREERREEMKERREERAESKEDVKENFKEAREEMREDVRDGKVIIAPAPGPGAVIERRTTVVDPAAPPPGVRVVEPARVKRTTTEMAPAPRIVRKTITTTTDGPPPRFVDQNRGVPGLIVDRRIDRTVARRKLSTAPIIVTAPPPPPIVVTTTPVPVSPSVTVTTPAPASPPVEVATTRTTTTTNDPTRIRRIYQPERNVVVVTQEDNQTREMPYVAVPVLFVKETAELLDQESADAIRDMAYAIQEVVGTEPAAIFDIEGHTSTEGTDEYNMDLSGKRAKFVLDELTTRYGIAPATLTAHGYGENYPNYPNGPEEQLALDRRVLVVRTK